MKKTAAFILTSFCVLTGCQDAPSQEDQSATAEPMEEQENDPQKKESPTMDSEKDNQSHTKNTSDSSEKEELTKEEATKVVQQYEQAISHTIDVMQDENPDNDYTSKEEIKKYYTDSMTEELAASNADSYFWTIEGQFEVKPRDGGIQLQTDQPYTFNQLEEEKYELVQERDNELFNHVKAHFIIVRENEQWVIKKISKEELE